MNAFHAGVLLILVLSLTTLGIDSSPIFALPSERPSNQIAADVSFHVIQGCEGEIAECEDTISGL